MLTYIAGADDLHVDVIVGLRSHSNGRMFPDGRLDMFCDILESFCGASCSLNMLMRCCMSPFLESSPVYNFLTSMMIVICIDAKC